jgi:hypothetical protein
MDPKQTIIDMLECIANRDMVGAEASLQYLAEWTRRLGFIPTDDIRAAIAAMKATPAARELGRKA